MTNQQRIRMRRSQIRQRLNELLGIEERSDEQSAEMQTLETEFNGLEVELRAAIIADGDEEEAESIETPPSEDGEGRELREIEQEATLANYIGHIAYGLPLEGAERELQQHVLSDASGDVRELRGRGGVPLQMLLTDAELHEWQHRNDPERLEERVRTPVADAAISEGTQETIAQFVYSRSVPAWFGINMPTVSAGSRGYPHIAGTTDFSMQAKGGAQAAVAGSFGGSELRPIRATATYEYSMEDMYELIGLQDALRMNLRRGLMNLYSEQVLNGDGTAPNVQGIRTAVSATPAADPADADDFGEVTARWAGLVDGLNAYELRELRTLMSKGTYDHLITLRQGMNPLDPMTAHDWLVARTGGVQVSSRFPAPASDISHSVVRLTGYPERSAVMPVWSGVRFIMDEGRLATQGETSLTIISFYNFRVLQTAGWAHLKVHD